MSTMLPTIILPIWFQVKVGHKVNVHKIGKADMKQQLSCLDQGRVPGLSVARPPFIDLLDAARAVAPPYSAIPPLQAYRVPDST